MKTHLVIPDSHAHPDYNNDRYTWLGRFICDLKPDVIVNLGDQADMPSLCSYDKGTKGFEGRRYKLDIESNRDANKRLFEPMLAMRAKQIYKKYTPKTIFCLGNHEHRIYRAIQAEAMLDGTIGLDDLGNEEYWDTIVPFLSTHVEDGIAYSHYFISGVMGRPIGGINPGRMMLNKLSMSATCGHAHTRDFAEGTKADGTPILAMSAGCYIDYHADFAAGANDMWWRGVVIKRNVEDGNYDHEWLSIKELERRYG